jgi:hypothetical protein
MLPATRGSLRTTIDRHTTTAFTYAVRIMEAAKSVPKARRTFLISGQPTSRSGAAETLAAAKATHRPPYARVEGEEGPISCGSAPEELRAEKRRVATRSEGAARAS